MNACHQPLGVVELRTAAPPDLPRIADLARLTWRHAYRDILSPAQIEYMLDWRYAPETLADDVASGRLTFTLLTDDGEPTAFAAYGPAVDPGELKLNQLYVHPDRQRHGLGSRLIRHVEAVARSLGRSALVLTVNRRNAHAIAAYHRNGFAIRESVDVDIGHGFVMEDFIMAKPVPPAPPPATPPSAT